MVRHGGSVGGWRAPGSEGEAGEDGAMLIPSAPDGSVDVAGSELLGSLAK
jgi:hypothetical protein